MEKKYLTKEELKEYQLNILRFIDYVCKKYDIKYFLSYGSLIGAIRHQGMIPWDDDIDISMYREEYEKFVDAVKKENNPRYEIMSYDTSDWYFQNFMVVIDNTTVLDDHVKYVKKDSSVFVDIFPIDRFSDLKIVKKTHLNVTLRQICYIKKHYIQYGDSKIKDFLRLIFWYALRPVNPRYFYRKIDKLIKKYSKENAVYEGSVGVDKEGLKNIYPKGTFEELIDAKFEDMILPIPKNYDMILRQLYGDYMQVPTQEEIDYKSHLLKAYLK